MSFDANQVLAVIGAVFVAATALHALLAAVAPLTKTDKDDAAAAKIGKALEKVRSFLARVGLDFTKKG